MKILSKPKINCQGFVSKKKNMVSYEITMNKICIFLDINYLDVQEGVNL